MFSYLNPNPVNSQPAQKSVATVESKEDVVDVEAELIKQHKTRMVAVPAGLVMNSRIGRSRGKMFKGKKSLMSKSYNPVAGRPMSNVQNKIRTYTANLRYDVTNIVQTSTTVPTFGASTFVLSSFDNYLEYLGLFDQYKIDEIEVWIEPAFGPAQSLTSVGQLYSCVDLDDANTPTTIISVEAHQSCITTSTVAGHYHKWVPHMAVAVYSGAFTSFANSPADWIDAASPNVQHYGVKLATTTSTTSTLTMAMQVRAKVSFRQSGL